MGRLQICVDDRCTLNGQGTPREQIEWIGLQDPGTVPPAVRAATDDEVHLRDRTVRSGALVGISAGVVLTERGSFEREDVAWIHLIAGSADLDGGPEQIGAPRDPPPSAAPSPEAPEPEPSPPPDTSTNDPPPSRPPGQRPPLPPRRPRPPGNGVKPCPAAKPLGAHVELLIKGTDTTVNFERSSRVRVWFDLAPSALWRGRWPDELTVPWMATDMTWKTEASACVDLPDPFEEVCKCPPSRDAGISDLADEGHIYFDPVRPELSMRFPRVISESGDVRQDCIGRYTESFDGANLFLGGGQHVHPPGRAPTDFLVAPTGCFDARGTKVPGCVKNPELYAVIPFVGSQEATTEEQRLKVRTRMRWEVCCGCGKPPRDMPEGEKDPCGGDEQQRGLLEVAVARAVALRNEMAPHFEQLKQQWKQAQAHKSDFDLVVKSCAGWDVAMLLMGYVAGGGASAPEAAKAFTAGLGILEQLLAQDPAVVLSAGAAFGLGGLDEANNIASLYSILSGAASDTTSAGSLAGMRAKLEYCAKDPTQSGLVYADAKLYLDHLAQVITESGEVARLNTEIQQADTEVMNRWHAWHRACLENAACRGLDPAICGPGPQ